VSKFDLTYKRSSDKQVQDVEMVLSGISIITLENQVWSLLEEL
jgi:hypothetical protein